MSKGTIDYIGTKLSIDLNPETITCPKHGKTEAWMDVGFNESPHDRYCMKCIAKKLEEIGVYKETINE